MLLSGAFTGAVVGSATGSNWVRIQCMNAVTGTLYPPEEIHRAVLEAVESRIMFSASEES